MSELPRIGLIVDEPRTLAGGRQSDPVSIVALRSTLRNMPRASGAKSLGERIRTTYPEAELGVYAWHYVTHARADGLAKQASRKIPDKEFGHLRADAAGVQSALTATRTVMEALESRLMFLRTPPSFSTGQTSRDRLAEFCAKSAEDGISTVWSPEGIWTDEEALAVGRASGAEVLLSVRVDRLGPELEDAWLRIDGELRGGAADRLCDALDVFETLPTLMFSGPRAIPNMRSFARAWAEY